MTAVKVKNQKTKKMLRSMIEKEKTILTNSIKLTNEKLREFEKKYNIKSSSFYKEFSKGKFGDDEDFMKWAAEYEILQELKQDIRELRGVKVVN